MHIEFAKELKEVSEKVDIEDFVVLKVLGRGTYGKVMLVQHKEEGIVYALKTLRKKNIVKTMQVDHTKAERKILEKMEHPFIVTLRYAFQTRLKLYMVFDYIPGGELFQHLKNEEFFKEDRTRFYASELFLALEFLHSKNIVYRDLKPENILLDADGHIKLTDFGLAKQLEKETEDGKAAGAKTSTFCGTDEYLAPEIILHQPYAESVDWWAFGVLIYEMLTGWPPWQENNRKVLYEKILHEPADLSNENLSEVAKSLLRGLLAKDVKARIKPADIKKHPFFASVDWMKVKVKGVTPTFKPNVKSVTDVGNFDKAFTEEDPMQESYAPAQMSTGASVQNDCFKGFTFIPDPSLENNEGVAANKIK